MSVKMSLGEAIVRFLDNQYVSFDGREEKFAEGFFTIFGHGCVLGVGEALSMAKQCIRARTSRAWRTLPSLTQNSTTGARYCPASLQ